MSEDDKKEGLLKSLENIKDKNKELLKDPRKKVNKRLKEKVLDNAGDLYNDQYYIYKDK